MKIKQMAGANKTWASLPRAKADISLSCASFDWSMLMRGRTAPRCTMCTCRKLNVKLRFKRYEHTFMTEERGKLWYPNIQKQLKRSISWATLQSESVAANCPSKRAASLWLSVQHELQLSTFVRLKIFYFAWTITRMKTWTKSVYQNTDDR